MLFLAFIFSIQDRINKNRKVKKPTENPVEIVAEIVEPKAAVLAEGNCPKCGGAIEFPARCVLEISDCPYCNEKIILRQRAVKQSWKSATGERGIQVGLLILLLAEFFIHGVITAICGLSLMALLVVGIPIAIFSKRLRERVGTAFIFWGILSFLNVLVVSFQITADLWGKTAAIIGVVLGIVGVIPEALIATFSKSEYEMFWVLILNLFLTVMAFILPPALFYQAKNKT